MRNERNKTRNSFCCASHSRSSVTACQIVAVGTVPQSVPLGTPRKPLQGLAVPQFHDFRRIGEKNTEKRSAHIPEKRAHAHSPHKPRVRLDRSGGPRIRSRGRARPESPRRAPCAVRSSGGSTENDGHGIENEGTVRRRKNSGFSPDSG